jgi:hypothetical protein
VSARDVPVGGFVLVEGVPYRRYVNGLFGALRDGTERGVLSPARLDEIGFFIITPTSTKESK